MSIINYKYRNKGYPIKFKKFQDIHSLFSLKLENERFPFQYYKDLQFSTKFIDIYNLDNTTTYSDGYVFNSTKYIKINNTINLNKNFTILLKVYFDNFIQQQTIFSNRINNLGISLEINPILYDNKIVLRYNEINYQFDMNILKENFWNKIRIIKNDNKIMILINNYYQQFDNTSYLRQYGNFVLGAQLLQVNNINCFYGGLNGKINDVYIYSKELTEKQLLNYF